MLRYRIWSFVRLFILFAAVAAIGGAVAFRVQEDSSNAAVALYNRQLTVVVGTAIADALNNATRTAEAPLKQHRLIAVGVDETLEAVAEEYSTTVEIIRIVNGLAPDVFTGNGEELIIPQDVQILDPPRRLEVHVARLGDTLITLAQLNNIPLSIIEEDNPVLAMRELIPGDIVFIADLL